MKDDTLYLRHMAEAIAKIDRYLTGISYEAFAANDLLIDGVIRELEIIGEAGNNISKEFQKSHPEIPFFNMISMRNRLIHDYAGVDIHTVWQTVKEDLPALQNFLRQVLSAL